MVKKAKRKTKKRKTTKSRKKRPEVIVTIPKNAKLTVKRKKKNPYHIEVVTDKQGKTSKKQTWYTPEYYEKQR